MRARDRVRERETDREKEIDKRVKEKETERKSGIARTRARTIKSSQRWARIIALRFNAKAGILAALTIKLTR